MICHPYMQKCSWSMCISSLLRFGEIVFSFYFLSFLLFNSFFFSLLLLNVWLCLRKKKEEKRNLNKISKSRSFQMCDMVGNVYAKQWRRRRSLATSLTVFDSFWNTYDIAPHRIATLHVLLREMFFSFHAIRFNAHSTFIYAFALTHDKHWYSAISLRPYMVWWLVF